MGSVGSFARQPQPSPGEAEMSTSDSDAPTSRPRPRSVEMPEGADLRAQHPPHGEVGALRQHRGVPCATEQPGPWRESARAVPWTVDDNAQTAIKAIQVSVSRRWGREANIQTPFRENRSRHIESENASRGIDCILPRLRHQSIRKGQTLGRSKKEWVRQWIPASPRNFPARAGCNRPDGVPKSAGAPKWSYRRVRFCRLSG